MRTLLPLLILVSTCWQAGFARAPRDEVHDRAAALLEADAPAGAAELLGAHLRREAEDLEARELYGRALLALDRRDEAAHWLALARDGLAAGGERRRASRVEKLLGEADPLARKREGLLAGLARDLVRAADRLLDSGQVERARDLLVRARPYAEGKLARETEALLERVARADAAVDLDAASERRAQGATLPALTVETEHYDLIGNLEPAVMEQLSVTVEDVFDQYVEIYFGGDERRAPAERPTIRIHATWEDMAAGWPGTPSPGLGGWWSPGANEIHGYDERTRGGSLAGTLFTVYHEASHQFMSAFTKRAGVPTWLNEGTACFFEGSTAMLDGRVLWPDAAIGRLRALVADLRAESREAPTLAELVAYPGPGSYPGHYYHHGWGLVYFLQQWEDPATREHAYRPLYRAYLDAAVGDAHRSLPLFRETFLGEDAPLAHATLEDFERDWRAWILDEVAPLHLAPRDRRRALRLARADAARAAADAASGSGRAAEARERDFLERALRDLEYVRGEIDVPERPNRDVLDALADVLEQLEREKTAAAMLEMLLDAADEGLVELSEDGYAERETRLRRLDRANFDLRRARSAERRHARRLAALVDEYREEEPDLVLRAYTLAAGAARALGEPEDWTARVGALRDEVRALDRLLGRVVPLAGAAEKWLRVTSSEPERFRASGDVVELDALRPTALADATVELRGEYVVRARIARDQPPRFGAAAGLVASGTAATDWIVVGVDDEGATRVWRLANSGTGSTRLRSVAVLRLPRVPADRLAFDLEVRRTLDGVLEVRLDEGEPVRYELPLELPAPTHAGVFCRDGAVRFEGLTAELIP